MRSSFDRKNDAGIAIAVCREELKATKDLSERAQWGTVSLLHHSIRWLWKSVLPIWRGGAAGAGLGTGNAHAWMGKARRFLDSTDGHPTGIERAQS